MSEFTAGAFDNGSDVTMAEAQDRIATTLIDRDPETNGSLGSVSELYERTEAGNTPDGNGLYPDDYQQEQQEAAEYEPESQESPDYEQESQEGEHPEDDPLEELADYARNETARQLANEQLQANPLTPSAALQEVDQVIAESGLSTPERAEECASSFCSAMGVPQDAVNPQLLSSTVNRTVLSAASVISAAMQGKMPQGLPPVSPQAAQMFSKDFLAGFGADARLLPAENQQVLAQTAFDGIANILQSGEFLGWPEDASMVNDPAMAVPFMQRFVSAFGQDPNNVDPAAALKFSDWLYGQVRSALVATSQRQPAQRQAEPQHRTSQPSSKRRSAIPKMETNQDLFDADALEIYRKEHGRL